MQALADWQGKREVARHLTKKKSNKIHEVTGGKAKAEYWELCLGQERGRADARSTEGFAPLLESTPAPATKKRKALLGPPKQNCKQQNLITCH